MKKKVLSVVLCATMIAAMVTGCGKSTESTGTESTGTESTATESTDTSETATESEASGETYKVYMISMDQMDQHWKTVDAACQEIADKYGNIDYTWSAPDVKDDAKQIECINNAVADGAQLIILAANGPDAVTASLQEAANEGVKFIYVDSAANFDAEATFATDNEAAGVTAGETLIEELNAKGITSGTIGIINVNASTASCVSREKGFRTALEGTEFEILETQYSEGDAAKSKDIASSYLTEGVVGIFGCNEGSTTGVGNAVQEASSTVVAVGFDQSDTIRELVNGGYLFATMVQNPYAMGSGAMEAAETVLTGGTLTETNVDTGVKVCKAGDFE